MAALVQIMAWHRTGNKPLSEPMLVCYTDAYISHSASLRPRQNGCHFADHIFKLIFLQENVCMFVKKIVCIFITISLKFVPVGPLVKSCH